MMDLIAAAERGDVATVRRLLAEGARVDARDERGRTALIAAAYANQIDVAEALITAGADVNVQDHTRQSAYLIATSEGYLDLLRLTLQAGADVRSTDSFNGTGLIRAADRGHVAIIKALLETDIDRNHVNRLGWTALLEAIILGDGGPRHTDVVRLLIDAGADVNLADGTGVTPLAHARQRGHREIVTLLQQAGATALAAVPSTRGPSPTALPASGPGIEPTAPAVQPPPHTLLVTNSSAHHISFVDPIRGPVARVEVGAAPWGLALAPDGLAYVTTAEGVAVVDVRRRERVTFIPYRSEVGSPAFGEYRSGGMGIAVAPDGRHVYAGVFLPDRSGRLEIIDAEQRTVIASVPIGVRPFQVLVSGDGRAVYTVDHDTFTVTAVDTTTLEARALAVQPLGNTGWSSWDKPHYAVLRGDGRLLLPFQGMTLVELDPATGAASARPMRAHTHQHGVTLTPDGRRLLIVGTGPAGAAQGEPRLTVLNLETLDERHIPLHRPHEQVALSPDGRLAYLTGGFTFANGGWDGLSIVDLEHDTVTELLVPDRPLDIAVIR